MEDRRRSKRQKMDVDLGIEWIRQDGDETEHEKFVHVHVKDLSKTGIGFTAKIPLKLKSYYNANLTIQAGETIETIIQIIRFKELENGEYEYGGVFIGMTEANKFKIEVYRLVMESKE